MVFDSQRVEERIINKPSSDLYLKASELILAALPLQNQINACNQELSALLWIEDSVFKEQRARELNDEIFGCNIEIQSLHEKARRLRAQAQSLYPGSSENSSLCCP